MTTLHDWMAREVIVTPRGGLQVRGVLIGTDTHGLTLDDSSPALHPEIRWGLVHLPWRNIAHTRPTTPATERTADHGNQ